VKAAYFYLMTQDVDRVRDVAPAHARYWADLRLAGYHGGPFADRSGGLITFEVDSAADARRVVERDPFVTERLVAESWLKDWREEGS
jgi:uncharacterized protein YciI